VARPMPLAAPVTRATLPAIERLKVLSFAKMSPPLLVIGVATGSGYYITARICM
jgi:hypothetical protein